MRRILFILYFLLMLLGADFLLAQNYVPFGIRYQETVKGDMLLVGNSILNSGSYPANAVYTGSATSNENVQLSYIDIDNDTNTFSSSAATVTLDNFHCVKVKKAFLYWSAVYSNEKLAPVQPELQKTLFKEVKFKTPSSSSYQTLQGTLVYDGGHSLSDHWQGGGAKHQRAYVYVADVTDLLEQTRLANNSFGGEYVVADLRAAYGIDNGVGYAGGWTLYVIYEKPTLPSKHITLFDGLSVVKRANPTLDIPISGFKTIPTGSVRANIAFSSLEGERKPGDRLQLNGYYMTAPGRGSNDFFNSKITDLNGDNNNKRPNSTNLFGFDAGIFNVSNPNNNVLANNQTSATLRITTDMDVIYPFMFAFSVEVIQPKVDIEKKVFIASGSAPGTDVTGGTVQLGDKLRYEIRFRNSGNDHAENMVLTDKLPVNLKYDDLVSSVKLSWKSNPVQPTDYEYDATTHEIKFYIPNGIIKKGSEWSKILFEVDVPPHCDDLRDACSNKIDNVVHATYKGYENPIDFTAQSVSLYDQTDCNGNITGPSTFIANLGTCKSKRDEVLCAKTLTLTAGSNFDSYQWRKNGVLIPAATSQTLVVTEAGTYTVEKKKAGCADMAEIITVKLHANALLTNPINPYATEVLTCGNDGSDYPQIYLCGTSSSKKLNLSVSGALSYKWEKRNEASCTVPATYPSTCPVRFESCTWNQVYNGNGFEVSDPGDYRVEITYAGGCVDIFYFKVTKTLLTPVVKVRDIICNTQGKITVEHPTSGYQYALKTAGASGTIIQPYQSSPEFTVTQDGSYVVLIRENLPASATVNYTTCVFEAPASIIKKNPKLTLTSEPLACENSKGKLRVQVSDIYPSFTYTVRQNNATGGVVYSAVATETSDLTISNLNDGTYYVEVTTPDGCKLTDIHSVAKIPDLQATATIKRHLMCGYGIVRVDVQGGTSGTNGYAYSIDGGTTYHYNAGQNFYEFQVTNTGTYTIKVVDSNNCSTQVTSPAVRTLTPPTFDTRVKLTDCGAKVSLEFINVTNPENFLLKYSVDGGLTSQVGTTFLNLTPGAVYTPTLIFETGSASCTVTKTVTLPTGNGPITVAFAGVSRLVGCLGSSGMAEVRVTNVQGGTPPYEYSFDNKGTWTSTQQGPMAPGVNQPVWVRDAQGCEFEMKVTIPNAPVAPVFTNAPVTYTCDGKGKIEVQSNQPSYTYIYSIDGGTTTTTSPIFDSLPPGTYTITISYSDPTVPRANVLIHEDFGSGSNTCSPQVWHQYGCRTNAIINDGYYSITSKGNSNVVLNNGCWTAPNDHTDPTNLTGRYLAMNVGNVGYNKPIYTKVVNDVIADQPIRYQMFVYNLCHCTSCGPPLFRIRLVNNLTGAIIGTPQDSGNIPVNGSNPNAWREFSGTIPPPGVTSLRVEIVSMSPVLNGNDLAIDDIYVYQPPQSCPFSDTIVVTVEPDKAFNTIANTKQVKNVTCNGGNDGRFQINLKNTATTGYWVSKNGAAFVQETANPFVWNGLAAGTHTVKFRYAQNSTNCEITETVTITEPTAITIAPIATQYLRCNPANVQVSVSASGGTGNLRYAIKQPDNVVINSTTPNFTLTQLGTHELTVTDVNNCTKVTTFTVAQAPTPTLTVDSTSNYCVTATAGATLVVNVANGTAPFTYRLNGTVVQANTNATTYTFANMQPANHVITVTDANGCVASLNQTIAAQFRTSGVSVEAITCKPAPANKGKIKVTLSGGYVPYTYVVKQGATIVQAQTNVTGTEVVYETTTAGTYTIEITDSKGCVVQETRALSAPTPPTVTFTKEDVKCYGSSTGVIKVTASGGMLPYTYKINGGASQSSNEFTGLPAGTYTITVTDTYQCETSISVTINQPLTGIRAFAGVSGLVGCGSGANADKARVRITNVTGGTGAYQYSFDNRASWVATNEGWVAPGTQTVYVRDANRCEYPMTVNVPEKIADPVITPTITYTCDGKGTVNFEPSIASYTYEYSIDGGTTWTTTSTFSGLTPGMHNIAVRYKNINVPNPDILIQEDFGVGQDTCSSNVSSSLFCAQNASPGAGRYVIGNTNSVFLNQNLTNWTKLNDHTQPSNPLSRMLFVDIGNVSTGDVLYKKTVQVEPNRTIKYQMYLFNLTKVGRGGALPEVEIRLVNPLTGTVIDSQLSGGITNSTGPNDWREFSGELSPGSTNSIEIQILALNWASGGSDMALDDIFVYQLPEVCPITVTKTIVIDSDKAFSAATLEVKNVSCHGGSDGEIKVEVRNFGTEYRYKLNSNAYQTATASSSLVVSNLAAGAHTLVLEYKQGGGSYGCTQTVTASVSEPTAFVVTPTILTQAQCSNNNRATVQLQVSGGTPKYQYSSDGGATWQASNLFTGLTPASYSFAVQDANGCTYTLTTPFTVPTPKTVAFTAIPTACYSGNNDGQIVVNVTDGNGGYAFNINGGIWQTPVATATLTYTFTNLSDGTYVVGVRDAYGCVTTQTVTLHPKLNVVVKSTKISTCSAGKIEVTATGGDGTYSYAFVPSGQVPTSSDYVATNAMTTITPTTYDVWIKSANCEKKETVTITTAVAPNFTATAIAPNCYGQTGTIKVTGITGDTPYTLTIADASNPTAPIATVSNYVNPTYDFTGLTASVTYLVTLKDTYGCSATKTVILEAKPEITAVFASIATGCFSVGQQVPVTMTISPTIISDYATSGFDLYYSLDGTTWLKVLNSVTTITTLQAGHRFTPLFKTIPTGSLASTPAVCLVALPQYTVPFPLSELAVATNLVPSFVGTCSSGGFTVRVTATGGNSPYQFAMGDPTNSSALTWITPSPSTSTSYDFTNLTPGRTYHFFVRDAGGCIQQNRHDIYDGYTAPISIQTEVTPACSNASTPTGSLKFVVERSASSTTTASTFNWQVVNKSTSAVVASGNNVTMPAVGATVAVSVPTPIPAPGTYYVEITENGTNCEWASADTTMYVQQPITGTSTATRQVTCDLPGLITIENLNGGGGNYRYELRSTGFTAPITATSLPISVPKSNISATATSPITVEVHVYDKYNCSERLNDVTLVIAAPPAVPTATVSNCNEPLSMTVTAPLGANYQYAINGGAWQAATLFTNLTPANYTLAVKDLATGCVTTNTTAFTVHPKLQATVQQKRLLGCGSGNEAQITIKVTNGSGAGNYRYEIPGVIGVSALTNSSTTEHVQDISAPGTYTVKVYDTAVAACPPIDFTVTIAPAVQPAFTTTKVEPLCNGDNNGRIFISETNLNLGAITYIINPSVTTLNPATKSFDGLPAGTYTITATAPAPNGCSSSTTVVLGEPTPLSVQSGFSTVTQFACTSGNTHNSALVTVDQTKITGGTAPYGVQLAYGTTIVNGTTLPISNLSGGTVTITVTDANGCSRVVTETVHPYEQLGSANATVSVTQQVSCAGNDENIQILVTAASSSTLTLAKLQYIKSDTQPVLTATWTTTNTFTGLGVGTHRFWVKHVDTGCMISVTHEVKEPNTFVIKTPTIQNPICKGGYAQSVTFDVVDDTYAGTYNWYVVSETTNLTQPPVIVPTGQKTATLTIGGTVLHAGTYTLVVTQATHPACENKYVFTIVEPETALTASVTTQPITCVTGNNDGIIEVTNATGGWGGYEYQLKIGTVVARAWQANPRFTGLTANTYVVEIKDAGGCEGTVSATVTLSNPTPLTATLTIGTQNCVAGNAQLVAVVSGGDGANYTFQLIKDGVDYGTPISNGTATATFTNLSAGAYQVKVVDSWNCDVTTAVATATTLYEPVTNIWVEVTKSITCSSPNSANIVVHHQGGNSGNLSFTLTTPAGVSTTQTNGTFTSGLTQAGTYTVTITDNLTSCTPTVKTFELEAAQTPSFTATQTQAVSCHGGNDGSFTVHLPATQTQGDYAITVTSAVVGFTTQNRTVTVVPSDNLFEGLKQGTYTVVVTSSRGCVHTETVVISEPTLLTVTATVVPFECNATNDAQTATLTVVASGGTTAYSYSIDGTDYSNTTGIFNIVDTGSVQNITVYVKDANGCATNTTLTVQPLPRITGVTVRRQAAITCLSSEQISITIAGGSGQGYTIESNVLSGAGAVLPATRTLSAGAYTTTFDLTKPGQYEFKIIDQATGCYETANYNVEAFNLITVTASQSKTVSCKGGSDGEITFETVNYVGGYVWELLDADTLGSLSPRISGTATATAMSVPVKNTITGVSAGRYILEINEGSTPFCTVTSTLILVTESENALTVSATLASPLTCNGADAVLNVTAAGGWGDYEYSLWLNGTQHSVYGTYTTTSTFYNLDAGNYQIFAKDKGGCVTSTTWNVVTPTPITTSVMTSTLQVACYGDKTASITVTVLGGGSGNYKYVLLTQTDSGIVESGAQDSPIFVGLGAGQYSVKVIDGWGCDQTTLPITVTQPARLQVHATISKTLTCLTQAEIVLTASGGTAPYQYSTSPTTGFSTTNTFSVSAGSYTFYAKDSNGCYSEISNTVEINSIPTLGLNIDTTSAYVKCNGGSTAVIRAEAYGGLGDYQYELLDGSGASFASPVINTDGVFAGLATGTYQVKVVSVDCNYVTPTPIVIQEAPALVVGVATSTDETCYNQKDGTIQVEVSGGTGQITYAISPRLDRVVTAQFIKEQKFEPGTYMVVARDENGCHLNFTFTIGAATQLVATLVDVTHETCLGNSDGTATITISGGKAPYYTAFNENSDTANWTEGKLHYDNLPAGENHTIFVKDANGCTAFVVIPRINPGVELQPQAEAVVSCSGGNTVHNRIVVSVNPVYASQVNYALDGGTPQASYIFNGVTTGTHTVTVSHPNGCVQDVSVFVPPYEPLSVVSTTTEITCHGANDGIIEFKVSGGSSSYTYTIEPQAGSFDSATQQFKNLPPGSYTVSVVDRLIGCVISDKFTFIEPSELTVVATTVTETCYGQNDGKLTFEIKGGRPNYAYQITDSDGNLIENGTATAGLVITKNNMSPKTYILTYTDAGGVCTKTETLVVGAAPNLEPTNKIEVKYECRATGDNTTQSVNYVEILFDNTIVNQSNTFYALNSTNIVDANRFDEFTGNRAVIRNIPQGSSYYITIFYKTCSYTLPASDYFDVENYQALSMNDVSDPKTMNQIKVEATGGKAPYTYYFNGSISENGNEYYIKPSDLGYINANGRSVKQIQVEVVDDLGCTRTLTIEREFVDIEIPNHFTPNGDGNNDNWGPKNSTSYPNLTISIYDRYGRLVKRLNKGETWNGKYNAKDLPTGDYWYILRLNEDENDKREYVGNMTLFR